MAINRRMLISGGATAGIVLLAGPTFAHHGWSWTADGFFELEGIIKDIYIGNRSQDPNETRMKAVRVIVNGKTYDVYPDRAKDI